MNTNWKDMTKQEKMRTIVCTIISFIGAGFAIADMSGSWEHADIGWMIAVALLLVVECKENWKKNRKLAILELIGGIVMIACTIGGKFL